MSAIYFTEHQIKSQLKQRKELKLFLERQITKSKRELSRIDYIFCTDEYLLELNKSVLKHHYYTDIITFNLSFDSTILEAEIYISVERVKDNATNFKVAYVNELHRVIFHGLLHLLGYNDKKPKEVKKMRNAENRLLKEYFL